MVYCSDATTATSATAATTATSATSATTAIKKSFEDELFKGSVMGSVEKATAYTYSNGTKLLFGVRYGDGDTEELELDECRALLIEAPWYIIP